LLITVFRGAVALVFIIGTLLNFFFFFISILEFFCSVFSEKENHININDYLPRNVCYCMNIHYISI
jgi:hypothetical protein